jgi:hypothetical protein
MFSKSTRVSFFHSDYLSVVESEVNAFIEALPEEYQIVYMRYYPPKYAGAQYVVYIMYEKMAVLTDYVKDMMKSDVQLLMNEEIE